MTAERTVRTVLDRAGHTYAEDAGIRLRDAPAPLYRLLVLSVLLSTRISAEIAVDAAAELVRGGMGTAARMRGASWQDRVDALGRAHYRRYDESTTTALGRGAELVGDQCRDDLRRLRADAGRDPDRIRAQLMQFPRIGPVGAEIFCREAQAVWPELRPALDGKALDGARAVGLPADRTGWPGSCAVTTSPVSRPRWSGWHSTGNSARRCEQHDRRRPAREYRAKPTPGRSGGPRGLDRLGPEERALLRPRAAGFVAPMLATLTDDRFSDPNWIFERKLDGVRVVAVRDGVTTWLWSRTEKPLDRTYPELVEALSRQAQADGRPRR